MARLKQVITYVEPTDVQKIKKKAGEKGFISHSAYLRALVLQDIKKK